MYTRLLVPLDGSSLAESALPVVERLALLGNAQVYLLHVIERSAPVTVHGERHLTSLEEANEYLDGVAQRLRAAGVAASFHAHEVPQGDVARCIIDHAEEVHADLIVLCIHGEGRVRQWLFGSIAQQVLRRGTTPVLLTRPPLGSETPRFDPQRVLVALDATEAAEAAIVPAADIARGLHATLHLVMVVATTGTVRGERRSATSLMPNASQMVLELERQDALEYLERLAASLSCPDLTVTSEVRRGDVASALAEEADEPGVGLVVLATHGRSGLQAVWAGSVAAALLARTRATVLLLRRIDA
jgi:nucleotide-binding universal stress UspA family protein